MFPSAEMVSILLQLMLSFSNTQIMYRLTETNSLSW